MSAAFCRVRGLHKRYGPVPALRDVSLDIARGEVVGLAGPNGAGKSTLARILAGFLAPTEGEVRVGELEPSEHRLQHGVGFLPEEPPPLPGLAGLDLLLSRATPAAAPLPLERLVDILAVRDLLSRPLRALSRGQRRRVLTAYALLGPSGVVILDEPDAGLDPHALDRLQKAVAACGRAGAAILLLSHQLPELEAMCHRILFVSDGRIAATLPRERLGERSARDLYRETVPWMGREERQ